MDPTLSKAARSTPRQTLADVVLTPAKAEVRSQRGASQLRAVAAEAIRRVSSQKAAALEIGLNESRLSHKLKDGSVTLAQLEVLGPVYAAEFGRVLLAQYGADAETPQDRARRVIPELIRELLAAVA